MKTIDSLLEIARAAAEKPETDQSLCGVCYLWDCFPKNSPFTITKGYDLDKSNIAKHIVTWQPKNAEVFLLAFKDLAEALRKIELYSGVEVLLRLVLKTSQKLR